MKNPFYRKLVKHGSGMGAEIVKLPIMRFLFFHQDVSLDRIIILGFYWGLPKERYHTGEMVYRRYFVIMWCGWPFQIRKY